MSAETTLLEPIETTFVAEMTVPVVAEVLKKIQEQLQKLVETFSNPLLESLQRLPQLFSKEMKTWASERYLETGNVDEFMTDLISYLDEYAALMPVVTYKYGLNGIQNGYTDSMSVIALNHLQKLAKEGLSTDRAQMELAVAKTVEAWMEDPSLQVGARLVGVSPRGAKTEGYPGLHKKNYIFITIFEKEMDSFQLRQYRSYELNTSLLSFQDTVQQIFSATPVLATPAKLERQDLQTINRLLSLNPAADLHQLETIIYRDKADWKVDIDHDLPHINAEAYYAEVSKITSLCVQTLESLLLAESDHAVATQQLDILITTVKEALVKWVETHATNYKKTDTPAYEIKEDELRQVWHAAVAKEEGRRLSQDQLTLLQNFRHLTRLNPNLPLKGLMSWGHCLAGTPFSMSTQVLRLQQLQLKNSGVMSAAEAESEFSLSLSQEQKDTLATELASLIRITVHSQVWYVPADYLEEPGCYWDETQDCVVGPCGIPLTQDTFAMTETVYQLLMQQLVTNDFSTDSELDLEQKTVAIKLFELLQNKLCKSSIGIDGWINNNVSVSDSLELGPQLKTLHRRMDESANPIWLLYTTVRELIVLNDADTIEALTKECQAEKHQNEQVLFDHTQLNTGKAFIFPQKTNQAFSAVA